MVLRDGLPITQLEDALVTAWPQLSGDRRIGAFVRAVNDGLSRPDRLAAALGRTARLAGRSDLVSLLGKLAGGCRSYLELFGLDHVFTGPGLDSFIRQAVVSAGGRRYYLDLFAEPGTGERRAGMERLGILLPGSANTIWRAMLRSRREEFSS